WRRFASAVFQLDVALMLGCSAIEGAGITVALGRPLTLLEVLQGSILQFIPLLLLVRFARNRLDAGRPLSLGPRALGVVLAAVLGGLATAYPVFERGHVGREIYGSVMPAALIAGALEVHGRALRAQALAHEMRETTARLDAQLQEARARALEA